MSDETETLRLIDVLKRHADEADALCRSLNELFEGHNTTACLMAMGAIIGSQMGGDEVDSRIMEDRMTLLVATINMQVGVQKMLGAEKHTLN